HLAQPFLAGQHASMQAHPDQALLQAPGSRLVGNHGEARPMLQAQGFQLDQTGMAGEREHLIAIGMSRHHIKGAQADGTGGPQHGDPLRFHRVPQPAAQSRTVNTGTAAVRLSMRSSTPPWPGSRLLLSLIPAWRLNMLSVRSPTTEISTTTAAPSSASSRSSLIQSR